MDKLKYALIGCGRISKKHIEALEANKDCFLPVACIDPEISRAEKNADDIKNIFPEANIKVYDSFENMFSENKIDVTSIATESGYHAKISLYALNNGSNVILEKPMALSVKDCEEMIETSKKTGKKIAVCFQNRFNPPVQKLKKALDKNKFGRVYHGQISIRWNRNMEYYNQASWRCTWELDGGALMNQCSHGIDLLQWTLGGKIKSVYGVVRKYNSPREAEDFGSAIVEFENGSVGIIEGTVCVYPKNLEEKLSVFGEKGTVVIGGVAVNHLETWRFEGEELTEDRIDPPNVYGFGHTALYKDFYDAIKENRKPFISAEDGKIAVEVILAIYRSMKTGEKINFPLDFSTGEMNNIDLRKISR